MSTTKKSKASVFTKTAVMILIMSMLFVLFAVTASAADYNIVGNIDAPVGGMTPDYECTFSGTNAGKMERVSVMWLDLTNGGEKLQLNDGKKFVKGHVYAFAFTMDGKGYFADTVSATIDGHTATVQTVSGHPTWRTFSYTFPAALTPLDFTTVSNFSVPVAGASPDFDVTLATAALGTTQKIASVSWLDVSANKGIYQSENYKFEAGHTYKVTFHLEPLGDNRFTSSPECTVRPVNGTILTTRMSVDNSYYAPDDGTGRAGSFTYFVEGTSITTVKLSGLDLPAKGKTPDQSISVSGSTFTNELVSWQDITGSSAVPLSATDKFVSGHTYMLSLALKPINYNYYFKDDGDADMTYSHPNGITINGLPLSSYTLYKAPNVDSYRDYSNFGGDLRLHITFSIPGEVSDFEITDLTAPVHGVAADYSASVTNTGFAVSEVRYAISGKDVSPYTGKAGDNLSIGVVVRANDGYTFASDSQLTAACSGLTFITAFKLASLAANERIFIFEYTVPAAPLAAPTNLRWDGTTAKWDAVANAYCYGVNFYKDGEYTGVCSAPLETSFDFQRDLTNYGPGAYTFKVEACANNDTPTYANSAESESPALNYQPTKISTASATVQAPVVGAKPDTTLTPGNSTQYSFDREYLIWTVGDTLHTRTLMTSTDTFEAGKTYWLVLRFEAKYGYYFDSTTVLTINGQTLTVSDTERKSRVEAYRSFTPSAAHTHSYTGTWQSDATNHWQLCSCGEKGNTAAHTYGAWKVTKAATETATGSRERTCAVCGYKQTEVIQKLSHTHSYTGAWKSDATNHWQLCSCGEKGNTAAHTYGAWKVTKAATETADGSRERVCAVCGYKQTEVIPMLSHTHAYGTEWKNDDSQHWHECDCGDKSDTAAHTFGEWTVTKEATEAEEGLKNRTCSACGYVESSVIPVLGHEHSYTEEWKSDAANHWNECDCGEVSNQAAHTFGEWETVKEATATEEGVRKRACSVCGYEEYEAISVNGTESTAPSEPDTSEPATSKPIPNDPENPEGSFPWWIIVVAVVAVGGIVTVVIVLVKKKK